MTWQRKLLLILIVMVIYLAIIGPSISQAAVDTSRCKNCHGNVTIIESSRITKSCLSCHDTHGTPPNCCEPTNRNPSVVHEYHKMTGGVLGAGVVKGGGGQPSCRVCHLPTSVGCTTCHNSHREMETENLKDDLCVNCHGKLPTPKGHESFRDALKQSKHRWMNCETCHKNYNVNGTNKFNLRFKDLLNVPIQNNTELCKICHSYQYDQYLGLTEGNHPKENKNNNGTNNTKISYTKTCVDCHNPHTTSYSGPIVEIEKNNTEVVPKIDLNSVKTSLYEKFPILDNPTVIIIFIIVIVAAISEYTLSIHEKGKKVASNLVKVEVDEENLLTLEVKLSDRNTLEIYDIIEKLGVDIVGTTLSKKTDEDKEIYVHILFIDTKGLDIDQDNLIDKIKAISNVVGIGITDKYEL